jgi:hypothetical protein
MCHVVSFCPSLHENDMGLNARIDIKSHDRARGGILRQSAICRVLSFVVRQLRCPSTKKFYDILAGIPKNAIELFQKSIASGYDKEPGSTFFFFAANVIRKKDYLVSSFLPSFFLYAIFIPLLAMLSKFM